MYMLTKCFAASYRCGRFLPIHTFRYHVSGRSGLLGGRNRGNLRGVLNLCFADSLTRFYRTRFGDMIADAMATKMSFKPLGLLMAFFVLRALMLVSSFPDSRRNDIQSQNNNQN